MHPQHEAGAEHSGPKCCIITAVDLRRNSVKFVAICFSPTSTTERRRCRLCLPVSVVTRDGAGLCHPFHIPIATAARRAAFRSDFAESIWVGSAHLLGLAGKSGQVGATEALVRPERAAFFPPSTLLPRLMLFRCLLHCRPLPPSIPSSYVMPVAYHHRQGRRSNWRWRRASRSVPSWVSP